MRYTAIFLSIVLMMNIIITQALKEKHLGTEIRSKKTKDLRNTNNILKNHLESLSRSKRELIEVDEYGCFFKNKTGYYEFQVPCKEVIGKNLTQAELADPPPFI